MVRLIPYLKVFLMNMIWKDAALIRLNEKEDYQQ